jgi:hypothetical protein
MSSSTKPANRKTVMAQSASAMLEDVHGKHEGDSFLHDFIKDPNQRIAAYHRYISLAAATQLGVVCFRTLAKAFLHNGYTDQRDIAATVLCFFVFFLFLLATGGSSWGKERPSVFKLYSISSFCLGAFLLLIFWQYHVLYPEQSEQLEVRKRVLERAVDVFSILPSAINVFLCVDYVTDTRQRLRQIKAEHEE